MTISNQAFVERHVPYQDAADLCYQKLQKELSGESAERPLQRHFTISDQELEEYRQRNRPDKKRR